MANAIYYSDLYLLLPERYPDYNSFMGFLQEATFPLDMKMVVLREDHNVTCWNIVKGICIAPYFLTGYHDEPSLVRFQSTEGIFPVQVELLDQDAYNTRLREVINGYCPGCKRFKPLSNRVQSLNGHHQEITLDGVCFYRYEENPSPRVFREYLFSLGGSFHPSHPWRNAFELNGMKDGLSSCYLRYKSLSCREEDGNTIYTAECKKGELLSPILTEFVSGYLGSVVSDKLHIEQVNYQTPTEEAILQLLSAENQEKFRKECKKYGICIGILSFDSSMQDLVTDSLSELENHFRMDALVTKPGRIYYLITDQSDVLKSLHYRAPLLQAAGAALELYTQSENRRYTLTFSMESEII